MLRGILAVKEVKGFVKKLEKIRKIMGRIVVVENCGQCPECGFTMNPVTREWDKQFCLIMGDDVKLDTMPDNCPLPTEVGRDYEAEIARLKRELYLHKYSNDYGKK